MNLDLENNRLNKNNIVQKFSEELKNYLIGIISDKEELSLITPTHNGNRITTKFRDIMFIERKKILNNYYQKTFDKGEMYYIYSHNSKNNNFYNLCICDEEKSHVVIELNKDELPDNVEIGSVLRRQDNNYVLDQEATQKIKNEIYNLKERLLNEQTKFLESKRIDGHIYEVSENNGDSIWLFDISNNSNECIEEPDFPEELLNSCNEGDLLIYTNGYYKKYNN